MMLQVLNHCSDIVNSCFSNDCSDGERNLNIWDLSNYGVHASAGVVCDTHVASRL